MTNQPSRTAHQITRKTVLANEIKKGRARLAALSAKPVRSLTRGQRDELEFLRWAFSPNTGR